MKAKDDANHPTVHKIVSTTVIWSKMSILPVFTSENYNREFTYSVLLWVDIWFVLCLGQL